MKVLLTGMEHMYFAPQFSNCMLVAPAHCFSELLDLKSGAMS